MAKSAMESLQIDVNTKLQQAIEFVEKGDTNNAVEIIRSIPNLNALLNSPDGADIAFLIKKAITHNNIDVIQTLHQSDIKFDEDILDWALTEEKVMPQTIQKLIECGSKLDSGQLVLAMTYPGQTHANLHTVLNSTTLELKYLFTNLGAAIAGKNHALIEPIINNTLENCKDLASKSKFLHMAMLAMSQPGDYMEQLKKSVLQLLQDPQAQDFVNIEDVIGSSPTTYNVTPVMLANDLDVVKSMHARGANLNAVVPQLNKSVISIIAGRLSSDKSSDEELLDYLLANVSKDSITNIDNNGNCAVYYIAMNCPQKLARLVKLGVDIDVVNNDGLTPLLKLIIDDKSESEGVKTLIALGAKIETAKFAKDAIVKYAKDNNLTNLQTWLKIAQDVDSSLGTNVNPPKYKDAADNELYELRLQSLQESANTNEAKLSKENGKQEVEVGSNTNAQIPYYHDDYYDPDEEADLEGDVYPMFDDN